MLGGLWLNDVEVPDCFEEIIESPFSLAQKMAFLRGFLDLPFNWDLKPFCGPDHFHTESQLQWHADATSLWNLTNAQEQKAGSRARQLVQFRPIKKVRQIRLMKVSASPGTSRPFQQMQDAPSMAKICWCPTHKLQIWQSVTRSNMYSCSSLIQSPSIWLSLAKKGQAGSRWRRLLFPWHRPHKRRKALSAPNLHQITSVSICRAGEKVLWKPRTPWILSKVDAFFLAKEMTWMKWRSSFGSRKLG